jgi:hypothetical protein
VTANWSSFGFGGTATVRDLWQHKDLGVHDGAISATLPAHGSRLFKVTPKGGTLKTNSYEAEASTNTVVGGAAVASCANCSGGAKVGNLYNGGALRINGVTVPKAGTYQVNIRYVTGDARSATLPAHGSRLFKVTPKGGTLKMAGYEAEASTNTLVGGAAVAGCADCSGGAKVGNLYNGGALRINGITVPKAGTYQVNIRYVTGDARSATVSANGQNAVTLAFPSSGGWDIPATVTVPVQLHAGTNTIEIDSTTPVYSPDIDKVEVPLTVR